MLCHKTEECAAYKVYPAERKAAKAGRRWPGESSALRAAPGRPSALPGRMNCRLTQLTNLFTKFWKTEP